MVWIKDLDPLYTIHVGVLGVLRVLGDPTKRYQLTILMLQQYLQSLDGMVTYQVISFALFLALFTGVLIWVVRMKREHTDRMARMPLDDSSPTHDPLHEVQP